jgi:four helix bundle protein
VQRFTVLKVWQRAHELVLAIYRLSQPFPPEERFGVTGQLRRAAVSVASNIAEGSKRRSNTEYARFLNTAEASLVETEYLVLLSRDLNYLDDSTATGLLAHVDEVARMLSALRSRVEGGAARKGSQNSLSTLNP